MRKYMMKLVLAVCAGVGVGAAASPASALDYACTFNDGGNQWGCNPDDEAGKWECWGGDRGECAGIGGFFDDLNGTCKFNAVPVQCVT